MLMLRKHAACVRKYVRMNAGVLQNHSIAKYVDPRVEYHARICRKNNRLNVKLETVSFPPFTKSRIFFLQEKAIDHLTRHMRLDG